MGEPSKKYKLDKEKLVTLVTIFVLFVVIVAAFKSKNKSYSSGFRVEIVPFNDGVLDSVYLIKNKEIEKIIRETFDIDPMHTKIAKIDPRLIEARLEQDAFVENAEVWLNISNQICVRIQQREPIMRIIDDNGGNYYLDKMGERVPISIYYAARVPIVTGNLPPYIQGFLKRDDYGLKYVFLLTKRLLADDFFSTNIQQVNINSAGEFTIIPLVGDQKILLGSYNNLEEKIQRLKIFYHKAMPYEGWKKYSVINVKYNGQIVCKKRG
jgi:cell division protein FtsQ